MLARIAMWLVAMGVLALVLVGGQAARLDRALYDLHMRHWGYAPGNDLVIVAIDAKSLAKVGRWPWPRARHAQVIDRLTDAGVRGIGLDVSMPEPDAADPRNDLALAQAIERNGRVVMPVYPEAAETGAPLEEMLPIPIIAGSIAGLGHVVVSMDPDGIVRGAYLQAGLGDPHWPAFALALRRSGTASAPASAASDDPAPSSPYVWTGERHVMLRYAGPAGSFDQVSYVDVLDGDVPDGLLRGRWVMLGATAEGLGDIIDTPDARMSGVEYQANLFESLQRGDLVVPLHFTAQFAIGGGVLAVPLFLFGLPGLRRAWRAALAGGVLAILLSLVLLRGGGLWWPPAPALLVLACGCAAWSMLAPRIRLTSASRPGHAE